MMKLDTTQVRKDFAETINRVAYGKERVVLRRRGKDLVAVVPIEDLHLLEELEDQRDVAEALAALAEAEGQVRIPWEQIKDEAGL